MPPLGPIKRRTLIRYLREVGFDGPYVGGAHQYMVRRQVRLALPDPHHDDIGRDLLVQILRQAGVAREEWERL